MSEIDPLESIIFDYTENTQIEAWLTKEPTPNSAKFQHNLLESRGDTRGRKHGSAEICTEIDMREHAHISDGYFYLHLRYVQYNPDDDEVLNSCPMIIRIYEQRRLPSRYSRQVHQMPLWIDPLDPNSYERTCKLSSPSDDWESGAFLLAVYRARQPFSPANIDGSELLDLYSPSKPGSHDSGCKPFLFASFKYETSVDKDDDGPAESAAATVSSSIASGFIQGGGNTSTPQSKASYMAIDARDAAIDATPSGSSKRAADMMLAHDIAATPTGRIPQGFNKISRPSSSGIPPRKKIRTEQPSKSSVNTKAIATSAAAVVRPSNRSDRGKERPTGISSLMIDLVSRSPTPEPVQVSEVHVQQRRLPTLPQNPEFVKSEELQRLERQVEIAAKDHNAARERLEVLTEAARYRLERELETYNHRNGQHSIAP